MSYLVSAVVTFIVSFTVAYNHEAIDAFIKGFL